MTIEDDTEWLRTRLGQESFHRDFPQKWVAVRDGKIAFSTSDHQAMQSWLAEQDSEKRCVLAFGDDRVLA
jgi:hypothetical protein